MISRSWRCATPAERGHDVAPLVEEAEESEPARAEHDPVPDTVERDGVPYHVDRCRRCGIYAPREDGVCSGQNRQITDFGSNGR